jgi:ribosome-interacting GTPase 1
MFKASSFIVSLTMTQGSSGGGEGFEVTKFGHGRVALIGFPRFAISMI